MRLVDADALITELNGIRYPGAPYVDAGIRIAIGKVCDAPTIEERKTGKWIIRDNPGTGWFRVTCSECGEDVTSVIPLIGFFPDCKALWNYCPDCGADMRGEQDGSD